MHMKGQKERRFRVVMKHDMKYRFVSQAGEDDRLHGEPYLSDEPDPVGDAAGPSTPSLLGSAIGHCLSASLLESLRKAHVDVAGFETEVVSVVQRNSEGFPRIERVEVILRPEIDHTSSATTRSEAEFEKHCTVCSSVKKGIDIRVSVDWRVADEKVV
jgi:uncharacterized OsmC-like protein